MIGIFMIISAAFAATCTLNTGSKTVICSGTGNIQNSADTNNPYGADAPLVQTVTIEEGVTTIPNYLFYNCNNLKVVTIASTVQSIGLHAFAYTAIEEFTFPQSTTVFPNGLFYGCPNIKTVNIHSGITKIGSHAFFKSGIQSYIVPDHITEIGDYAFAKTTKLTSVSLGNAVTLGKWLFAGSEQLTSVTFPKTMTRIPEGTFSRATWLKSYTIPEHIKVIGKYAFSGCENLQKVVLPEGVETIEEGAFMYSGITEIEIPTSMKTIETKVFDECGKLTTVKFHDNVETIAPYAFYQCPSLETVYLPSGVKKIDQYAFRTCDNLKTVHYEGLTAPESCSELAFKNCDSLKSIKVTSEYEGAVLCGLPTEGGKQPKSGAAGSRTIVSVLCLLFILLLGM